jgi:hypothetical protein
MQNLHIELDSAVEPIRPPLEIPKKAWAPARFYQGEGMGRVMKKIPWLVISNLILVLKSLPQKKRSKLIQST